MTATRQRSEEADMGKEGRVFLRGMSSEQYGLKEFRRAQLAAPRVRNDDVLVVVHTDSVHRHFNDGDETAKALVMKAKSTWMYFGLIQQGRSAAIEDEERFGPREDWSRIWTDGVDERKKVVKPADTVWETTRDGKVRILCSKDTPDVRVFSVDVYEQEIRP